MDKITHEDLNPQTERGPTSPFSPKRPRMDCPVTNNHSGKPRFDFPEILRFQKTIGSPSSQNALEKNVVLICTAGSGDIQDENPYEQPQDTKLIVTPITKMTASHTKIAQAGLSKVCFIIAEKHLLHLGNNEQPPLTETDELSSYQLGNAGGALAEAHTSGDTSADTSCHPDCERLGKSLEDEPPGGSCLPAGNDEDGGQVQNNVSQIQAFTFSSNDEEVRCQSDYSYKGALPDAGFCNTWSQSSGVKVNHQNKLGFSENIFFSKEEEGANIHISPTDYADSKSFYSNPEEDPSRNLTEGVKNEEEISELHICENITVAVRDGHINENDTSKNSIAPVGELAGGSTVSYDVVLARNTAAENMSVEAGDFCGAKGEHAAGKMIAEVWSETADHTTVPARISQEPAEGDNDPGPFSVIHPAIWSETDREAKEKRCNSEGTAGVELAPSVKVCKMETHLLLFSDIRVSQEVSFPGQTVRFYHQSTSQQSKDEKEDFCQSYAEPQAYPTPINETHNVTGGESSCHWKSSPSSSPHRPSKPPPAGDGRHESHSSVKHQLKEQDHCFPLSPDQLKPQEAEYSQTGMTRMDKTVEIKESFVEQLKTDGHWDLEKTVESEEELLQQIEKKKENTKEISSGVCVSDCTKGEVGEDEETAEQKEGKEEKSVGEEIKTDGQENSEIYVKTEDDKQQQKEHKTNTTEVLHVECISEWTEANSQISQHEQGNKLSGFLDDKNRAESCMVENKETSPTTSDAVVPCQHDFSHSQNANNYPTALNCNDRSSPVPSAATFYEWLPGGFDTFEKIQLSSDDDDGDAAGLGNSPLLTSLPGQLLKTSEQQLSHSTPGAESGEHKEIDREEEVEAEEEGEEEVERLGNMANTFLSCDSTCNEIPNFISEVGIIAPGRPEQQPNNGESACESRERIQDELNPQSVSSTASTESGSPSDVTNFPGFEMKEQFDVVLKELDLYFDTSASDFASGSGALSPVRHSDKTDASEGSTSNCKGHLSSPELRCHRDTSSDDDDEDSSLEVCGGDPVVSRATGSCDTEQVVPPDNYMCQKTSIYAAEKHREPREVEQRMKMWSPSFMCPPLLEQLSHRPPEQPRRLGPLRTCTRPIRVGLSKRTKTKHLHRPHPYK